MIVRDADVAGIARRPGPGRWAPARRARVDRPRTGRRPAPNAATSARRSGARTRRSHGGRQRRGGTRPRTARGRAAQPTSCCSHSAARHRRRRPLRPAAPAARCAPAGPVDRPESPARRGPAPGSHSRAGERRARGCSGQRIDTHEGCASSPPIRKRRPARIRSGHRIAASTTESADQNAAGPGLRRARPPAAALTCAAYPGAGGRGRRSSRRGRGWTGRRRSRRWRPGGRPC